MIGDVYDYNKNEIKIMSGEKRIVIPLKEGELDYWKKNGLNYLNKGVVFDPDTKKIIKFI